MVPTYLTEPVLKVLWGGDWAGLPTSWCCILSRYMLVTQTALWQQTYSKCWFLFFFSYIKKKKNWFHSDKNLIFSQICETMGKLTFLQNASHHLPLTSPQRTDTETADQASPLDKWVKSTKPHEFGLVVQSAHLQSTTVFFPKQHSHLFCELSKKTHTWALTG